MDPRLRWRRGARGSGGCGRLCGHGRARRVLADLPGCHGCARCRRRRRRRCRLPPGSRDRPGARRLPAPAGAAPVRTRRRGRRPPVAADAHADRGPQPAWLAAAQRRRGHACRGVASGPRARAGSHRHGPGLESGQLRRARADGAMAGLCWRPRRRPRLARRGPGTQSGQRRGTTAGPVAGITLRRRGRRGRNRGGLPGGPVRGHRRLPGAGATRSGRGAGAGQAPPTRGRGRSSGSTARDHRRKLSRGAARQLRGGSPFRRRLGAGCAAGASRLAVRILDVRGNAGALAPGASCGRRHR